jgi:hypothetical protein
VWTTEFEAEVLDLDTFAGGLTPLKKGGSLQTKNLRLLGSDGREYKFRSLNKEGKRALPPDLQESIVADIYQDQISIGNPMASVVVPRLLNAVGVLNAEPRIVIMPQSERLGEFNNEFAGVLGTIEEHPKAGMDNSTNFGNADEIVDGFEVFEKLRRDNDERIDDVEFLKARLMDLLLGDRDRHADQWRWAGYGRDGERVWKPIPRDRDFAFGRYDGFFPWAAGLLVHSAVGFGENYPSILELTWIGRHLDRRFLNGLDKPIWDSVTAYLQRTLTDSVMQHALFAMPPEMNRRHGEQMFRMLKARRETLHDAANEFYTLLSDVVDIYGSDKPERVEVKLLDSDLVEVSMYKKKSATLLYRRTFSKEHTNEIRIHLLGGDDIAVVEGSGSGGILVRILGGDGDDQFNNRSEGTGAEFYDIKNYKSVIGGTRTPTVLESDTSLFSEDVLEPKLEDRYRIVRVLPFLNFNSDDGVILGGFLDLTQYAFHANPYAHYGTITFQYAPFFNRYDAQVYAESYKVVRKARAEIFVKAGNLGLSSFFGLGNETSLNDSLYNADFYRSNYHSIFVEPSVHVNLSKAFTLRFAGRFEYTNARYTQNSLLNQIQPYGLGNHSGLALSVSCSYDARDNALMPSKGILLSAGGTFYPAFLGYDFAFSKVIGDVRAYLPASPIVFSFHVGGEKSIGTYPFYQASLIGGVSTVRGYARNRFAGDASLYGQTEIRMQIAAVNIFVPGTLGLSFFGDAGRVFLAGERSRKWHGAFGGGLWLNAINRFVLNLSVASSAEDFRVYVTSGFAF